MGLTPVDIRSFSLNKRTKSLGYQRREIDMLNSGFNFMSSYLSFGRLGDLVFLSICIGFRQFTEGNSGFAEQDPVDLSAEWKWTERGECVSFATLRSRSNNPFERYKEVQQSARYDGKLPNYDLGLANDRTSRTCQAMSQQRRSRNRVPNHTLNHQTSDTTQMKTSPIKREAWRRPLTK